MYMHLYIRLKRYITGNHWFGFTIEIYCLDIIYDSSPPPSVEFSWDMDASNSIGDHMFSSGSLENDSSSLVGSRSYSSIVEEVIYKYIPNIILILLLPCSLFIEFCFKN